MPQEQEHPESTSHDTTEPLEPRDENEPKKKKHRGPKHPEHAARQAARYRVERNQAREERDAALLELAFTKAAAGRFADPSAAFKLAEPSLLNIDADREPVGIDEAIQAIAEEHPFLVADDTGTPGEHDAFRNATSSSGRVMNGPKKRADRLNRKALESKYPALRRR